MSHVCSFPDLNMAWQCLTYHVHCPLSASNFHRLKSSQRCTFAQASSCRFEEISCACWLSLWLQRIAFPRSQTNLLHLLLCPHQNLKKHQNPWLPNPLNFLRTQTSKTFCLRYHWNSQRQCHHTSPCGWQPSSRSSPRHPHLAGPNPLQDFVVKVWLQALFQIVPGKWSSVPVQVILWSSGMEMLTNCDA